jgi:hypothetical protein
VLLLHRRMSRTHVLAGVSAALAAGSVSSDVVAIEARKAATVGLSTKDEAAESTVDTAAPEPRRSRARLVTLPARRHAQQLPPDDRPPPCLADYDQLLTRTTTSGRVS